MPHTSPSSALQIPPNGVTAVAISPSNSSHSSSHAPSPSASPLRAISPTATPPGNTGIVVFSGGSAANNLVEVFEHVRDANQCNLSYVIPISDNGGSTSEIIRVFGGPGSYYKHPIDIQMMLTW